MAINNSDFEVLISQGLSLLEEAEKAEKSENWATAIFKYQQAADIFSQCKLPRSKIDEIYERIAFLNRIKEDNKKKAQAAPQINVDELQSQAFQLIDTAKVLEKQGACLDSIDCYMKAVQLLIEAGWDESQLKGFKTEVERVQKKMASLAAAVPSPIEAQPEFIPPIESQPIQQNVVKAPQPKQANVFSATPMEQIRKFEGALSSSSGFTPKYNPQKQSTSVVPIDPSDTAFSLIDQAKIMVKEEKFQEAVAKYQNAIQLLKQAGWSDDQIGGIQNEISKLNLKLNKGMEKSGPTQTQTISEDFIPAFKQFDQKQITPFNISQDLQKIQQNQTYIPSFQQFDQKDVIPYNTSKTKSIQEPEQAFMPTFSKIQSQINEYQPLKTAPKKEEEYVPGFLQFQQEQPKPAIIQQNQSPVSYQSAAIPEIDQSAVIENIKIHNEEARRELERKKQLEEEQQNKAFKLLDEAKKHENLKEYQNAIEKYIDAADILNNIGWVMETNKIYTVIEQLEQKIEDDKKKNIQKSLEIKPEIPEISQSSVNVLDSNKSPISDEKSSVFVIRDLENKKLESQKQQDEAFKLLQEGEKKASLRNYEDAIMDYNRAMTILNKIGWADYTIRIQDAINHLIEEKKTYEETLQKRITRQSVVTKEDNKIIQDAIQKEASYSAEKLKTFEEDKTREIEIQNNALSLISSAQDLVYKQQYDEALAKYEEAIDLLIRIGWQNQIIQLNEVIKNIREEKKQYELSQQKDLIERLERQKKDVELRGKLAEQMEKERIAAEKAKKTAEYQARQQMQKEAQEKAFKLMDEANHISKAEQVDYDKAIGLYENAIKILSDAGWSGELEYISNIIENLKEEKLRKLNERQIKQKQVQDSTKEYEEFQAALKTQMDNYESNKKKQLNRLESFQEQQGYQQSIEKRAFELMDEAEKLASQKAYIDAAESYKMAIEEFKKINWTSQIKYIEQEMMRMFKLQQEHEKAYALLQQQKELEMKKKEEEQKKVIDQKQKEKSESQDLAQMIRNAAKQVEVKKIEQSIISEEEKKIYQISEVQKQKKLELTSLHDSIKAAVQDKLKDIDVKKDFVKKDLEEFKSLIKTAADKSKKQETKK